MSMFWPFAPTGLRLGTCSPHLPFTGFDLSSAEQRYHALVVGKSGSGKSKLLQHLALSHIRRSFRPPEGPGRFSSHGLTVVDPHHDLAWGILESLVAEGFYERFDAFDRVVYVDFGNDFYVPFNVLAGSGDAHERASLCLDAMLRVFPELAQAPLFTELFLAGVVVLMKNRYPLTQLHRLYADARFRADCLRGVQDDEVVALTFSNFDRLHESDQLREAGSTVRRAVQLVFNASTRLTLGQPENFLPLRQFIDEGRFIILNLGGIHDSLSRRILGALFMVQLEQAALSRTDIMPTARVQHTVLVDEWPVFAAADESLAHILSQARKFGLNIYLSCQSLAAISARRLAGAFENCRLGIFFALGHDSAELSSRQIADLDPYAVKAAIMGGAAAGDDARSPTAHDQYLPILDQVTQWTSALKHLSPRYCYIKNDTRPAVQVRTPWIAQPRVDPHDMAAVLAAYRARYQRTKEHAERRSRECVAAPDETVTRSGGGDPFMWDNTD